MTNNFETTAPGNLPPEKPPKVRRCLRYEAPFPSTWSGERICSRCKNSSAWRIGGPLRSPAVQR